LIDGKTTTTTAVSSLLRCFPRGARLDGVSPKQAIAVGDHRFDLKLRTKAGLDAIGFVAAEPMKDAAQLSARHLRDPPICFRDSKLAPLLEHDRSVHALFSFASSALSIRWGFVEYGTLRRINHECS
jgi:hypothetical protein